MNGNAITFDILFFTAAGIFLLSYVLIVLDWVHKTVVALCGAALMIVLGIVTQKEAFHLPELGIDWNVIFLLFSMMVFINIMRPSGIFEYIAIRSAKLVKARPFAVMALFSVVTALLSALLDNVTTVLLIAPVTVFVCQALDLEPVPFLITEALASNIGGAATLVGDPPNIMIASKAGLTFMDFINNMAPVIVVIMIAYLVSIKFIFGKNMIVSDEHRQRIMAMDERVTIKNKGLMIKSLIVLAITMTGFVFHGVIHLEPATVALSGAAIMLLVSRVKEPHRLLSEVEWSTLFFFIGLFVIIGGVVKVGLIKWLSVKMLLLTGGEMFGLSIAVMWFSAFASAFIDNIPYVATMNPLIIDMAKQLWPNLSGAALLHHPNLMPVWWSLALGACLGGNGTIIGASANVIIAGMSEKIGKKITFGRFMLYGMPLMIESVIISMLYVWLRYYILA